MEILQFSSIKNTLIKIKSWIKIRRKKVYVAKMKRFIPHAFCWAVLSLKHNVKMHRPFPFHMFHPSYVIEVWVDICLKIIAPWVKVTRKIIRPENRQHPAMLSGTRQIFIYKYTPWTKVRSLWTLFHITYVT